MPRGNDKLDWARLALETAKAQQEAWEHSPEYLDRINRDRVAMQLRQQGWEKQQGTSQAQMYGEQTRKNMELKAKLDAENFELRYTAKDKASISKLRNQERRAYQMMQSGEITPDEYEKVSKITKNQEMGIIPGMLPSLSPYPKGQGTGDSYFNKIGMPVYRNEKGIEVPLDWKKTPQGMAEEQEAKAIEAKAKLDAKREEQKESYRLKLMDKEIVAAEGSRNLTPQEIQERMDRAYPSPEADAEKVSSARQYIASVMDQYGDSPPPEVQQAMQEAISILQRTRKK